jgi:hypothetical protein
LVRHIVMWKIHPEKKADSMGEMRQRLLDLANVIEQIKFLEVGINYLDDPAAYDIILVSHFKSRQDVEIYQKHPAHLDVVQFIRTISLDRKVVDYEL